MVRSKRGAYQGVSSQIRQLTHEKLRKSLFEIDFV